LVVERDSICKKRGQEYYKDLALTHIN